MKDDQRPPLFFVTTGPSGNVDSPIGVFFVNNSPETLSRVKAGSGGFETVDENDPKGFVVQSSSEAEYSDVAPKEAVKISEYHPIYDSDFLMQLRITIASETLGTKCFTIYGKGDFKDEALLLGA